jgi:hypothetical protein
MYKHTVDSLWGCHSGRSFIHKSLSEDHHCEPSILKVSQNKREIQKKIISKYYHFVAHVQCIDHLGIRPWPACFHALAEGTAL